MTIFVGGEIKNRHLLGFLSLLNKLVFMVRKSWLILTQGLLSPYRSFSEIPESPRCVPDSAKLSEKRMHFVREKRDKPPGRRFHAEKRLSEKRDKREEIYLSAVC
jgi:hypothetical protein